MIFDMSTFDWYIWEHASIYIVDRLSTNWSDQKPRELNGTRHVRVRLWSRSIRTHYIMRRLHVKSQSYQRDNGATSAFERLRKRTATQPDTTGCWSCCQFTCRRLLFQRASVITAAWHKRRNDILINGGCNNKLSQTTATATTLPCIWFNFMAGWDWNSNATVPLEMTSLGNINVTWIPMLKLNNNQLCRYVMRYHGVRMKLKMKRQTTTSLISVNQVYNQLDPIIIIEIHYLFINIHEINSRRHVTGGIEEI